MIRQEYINHIASASGMPRIGDVKVPTRAQLVTPASLGAGSWTPPGYGYQYVLEDGMVNLWTDYTVAFNTSAQMAVPLIDYYAQWRPSPGSGQVDPYAAYPTEKKLAADQTPVVTSAYRNPERNEAVGSVPTSNHMLGRALDISVNNIGESGTQSRGMAFYTAWKAIHGANPGDAGYQNTVSRFEGIFPDGSSSNVAWADYWQLEGKNGPTDVVLKSHTGWQKLADQKDKNKNGILDGYERTFHLHIADRPNYGAHK